MDVAVRGVGALVGVAHVMYMSMSGCGRLMWWSKMGEWVWQSGVWGISGCGMD